MLKTMLDFPGIDGQTGLKNLGGDLELLEEILIKFLDKYATFDARKTLDESPEEFVIVMHTLKGTGALLGFMSLSIMAGKLESLCRNHSPIPDHYLDQFNVEIQSIQQLKRMFEKIRMQ